MRGAVDGLSSPAPIVERLPAVYQEEEFVGRFVSAFDAGLAPVLATLDALHAYVDPWLAPVDFLDWLAGWVAVVLDDGWSVDQRREFVASAVRLHAVRGTVSGVADAVRLAAGPSARRIEILDSGGASWSAAPGSALPGEAVARLTVRVHAADPDGLDRRRIEAAVESAKPAHVPHTVEVVPA
jgi:phage tail-like protein